MRLDFDEGVDKMPGILEGKVALVTGGSSGIGRATALAVAREGAKVVVADVQIMSGEEIAEKIRDAGGEAVFVRTDVSEAVEVEAMVDAAINTYGRLDCACNIAGIEGVLTSTVECTEENWDKTMNINLKGMWLCMKYEIPHMLKQRGGAIVNMASVAGLVGFRYSPAYCASKGGVIQLTKVAALEYSRAGIRVNAVCPGIIRTPMIERVTHGSLEAEAQYTAITPVGRMGTPEEIAEVFIWLCSEKSSFVTGHMMVADGGLIAQ